MVFSQLQVRQLQQYLGLSSNQLLPNSQLRLCLDVVIHNDEQFNLGLEKSIKRDLDEIVELDKKIIEIESSTSLAIKREKIEQEQEVEYHVGVNLTAGMRKRKADLITNISRDIKIRRNRNSGRLIRS